MVWYSHLFQNFPQFIVIYTVKGIGIVNKAEIDIFLELFCFFHDPADVGNLSLVPLPFLKPAWTSGSSWFTFCWSLAWRILSITLLACEMSAIVRYLSILILISICINGGGEGKKCPFKYSSLRIESLLLPLETQVEENKHWTHLHRIVTKLWLKARNLGY